MKIAKIENKKQLVKNFTWLTIIQSANYIVPLIVIPYIVRIVGVELFGKISYAQNIVSYFTLVINFGFDYLATREISINKGDKHEINRIFWSVIKQKVLLFVVSFLVLIIVGMQISRIWNDFLLYFIIFGLNLGIMTFPTWFFQGIEDMSKMAIFNLVIKSTGLLLTFIFVKLKSEYILYPLFTSLSYIIVGFISFLYVVKTYNLKIEFTKISYDLILFKKSFPIFLNNLFVSLYTVANITILGMYKNEYEVGIYSGAFKIISAILMMTSMPLNTSIFPSVSREFTNSIPNGLKLLKKTILVSSFVLLFLFLILFLSSDFIVKILLGHDFTASISIFRVLSILPLLVTLASLLTIQGLYGMGLQKFAPFVGLTIGIISISLNLIFIPRFGTIAIAWIWVLSQMMEVLIVSLILKKHIRKHEN